MMIGDEGRATRARIEAIEQRLECGDTSQAKSDIEWLIAMVKRDAADLVKLIGREIVRQDAENRNAQGQ